MIDLALKVYIQCVNLPENSYKCLSCPNGFRDSDGGCIDIKECEEFSSCDTELGVKCTNTGSSVTRVLLATRATPLKVLGNQKKNKNGRYQRM